MSEGVREAIVKAARSWIGTPFAHFQCCKGAGVDCAHLIIGVGKDVGLFPPDFSVPYYSPQWLLNSKASLLLDTLTCTGFSEKPPAERQAGDVLVFEIGVVECHVGIYLGTDRMVHAHHANVGAQVREFRLMSQWRGANLTRAFAYPGVEP